MKKEAGPRGRSLPKRELNFAGLCVYESKKYEERNSERGSLRQSTILVGLLAKKGTASLQKRALQPGRSRRCLAGLKTAFLTMIFTREKEGDD